MAISTRDKILAKIRTAIATPTAKPFPDTAADELIFAPPDMEMDVLFAEKFSALQGQFSYCISEQEAVAQIGDLATHKGWNKLHCNSSQIQNYFKKYDWPLGWHAHLVDCNAAITGCEALVARTGSIVISSAASGGRTPSVYAPVHICVAYTSQLVYNVADALEMIREKYDQHIPSLISFASGPSRTADIEKTLVTGVHGPKEVFCFLIEG